MENHQIAKAFSDVSSLMQAKGENIYKVRAHAKASNVLSKLSFRVADVVDDEECLKSIPGFGEAIVEKTRELVATGHMDLLERLKKETPPGILKLMEIPGIGPKTAMLAASQMDIDSFDKLAISIESGQFERLPRISKKLAGTILL